LTIKLFSAMNLGSFALILVVTNFIVHGPLRVQVLGWICVSISVSVFAAPLSIVVRRIPYLIHVLVKWFDCIFYISYFLALAGTSCSHKECRVYAFQFVIYPYTERHNVVWLWALSQGHMHRCKCCRTNTTDELF